MERIRKFITADKLERAIDELIDTLRGKDANTNIINELTQFQATLTKNRKDGRRGLISNQEENQTRTRVRFAILEMIEEIQDVVAGLEDPPPPDTPTVFISYNHGDREVVKKLKSSLEASGIDVRIDYETMQAGENIAEFLERSIRDTDVTLSVVSNRSLLSAWVAMETINTFYHEKFNSHKKFIACYIDDDFFHTHFRLDATTQIDARIKEIDTELPEYAEKKIDTNDLNNEKSRLYKLRNNLGDFLLRLRESLTLDIRKDKFDENISKILQAIKSRK